MLLGLQAVEGLEADDARTHDNDKRSGVSEDSMRKTLPHLPPMAADLIELVWWTGARPSELLGLTPAAIDRSAEPWTVELADHKTKRKGKDRFLDFGPEARAILKRYLHRVPTPAEDGLLFTPEAAMAAHRAERRANRKTKLYDSHVERYEREKSKRDRPEFAEEYTAAVLRKAVARAAKRAKVEHWTPYQLRHSALTRIRLAHGLEAAKAVGGHSTTRMTEDYSREAEREVARQAVEQSG